MQATAIRSSTPANAPQGRLPDNKDPANKMVPIIRHADVKRMLLAQKAYVEGGAGPVPVCIPARG